MSKPRFSTYEEAEAAFDRGELYNEYAEWLLAGNHSMAATLDDGLVEAMENGDGAEDFIESLL
jgi:cytochrome P450